MPRQTTPCERLADPADARVWTAHGHIDLTSVTAGNQILLGGHVFWVASMQFVTVGSATGDPRAGHDFVAVVGQVDLKLTHAQWKGCPAVERPETRMPQAWQRDLELLRDAALRLLARPETTAADAAFLRAQLAPLVDLETERTHHA